MFSLEKESDKETTILKHVEILKQRETCPLWSQRGNLGPMGRIYKVGQSLASSVRERRTPTQEGGLPLRELVLERTPNGAPLNGL